MSADVDRATRMKVKPLGVRQSEPEASEQLAHLMRRKAR